MSLTNIAKAILPSSIVRRVQNYKLQKSISELNSLSTEEVFTTIYTKGMWGSSQKDGRPFYSGSGSHEDVVVTTYISALSEFLSGSPEKLDIVDLGCGDFSVGSQIRPFCGRYVACDIVKSLIEFNQQEYAALDVDFRHVNIIEDALPDGDICIVRQVLQHLSNADIAKVLEKMKGKYKRLIITEHVPDNPDFEPNQDKPTGHHIRLTYGSGVVLTAAPFNLAVSEETQLCEVPSAGGIIRTMLYTLA